MGRISITVTITAALLRRYLAHSIIGLLLASLLLTFDKSGWSRVFFYLASYVSLLAVMINWRQMPAKPDRLLVLVLFLLGLSKLLWFLVIYLGQDNFDKYNSYFITGKRLLLAAVIGWAVFSLRDAVSPPLRRWIGWAVIATFIFASLIGSYQALTQPVARIDFYLRHATDSSYLYCAIALCTIIILAHSERRYAQWLLAVVLIVACWLIFKTGTRNVLFSFPLILLCTVMLWHQQGFRKLRFIALFMLLALAVGYKPFIQPKINNTLEEIRLYQQYQGDKFASLTSRLAMWSAGYQAFKASPFGMSMEQRQAFFHHYTAQQHSDKSALRYVHVHLHNELMDTASQQGIFGVIILLFSYVSWLWLAIQQKNNLLLALTLSIISVGLSDVVFISREQTVFFSSLMILLTLFANGRQGKMAEK